jgi:hypothetical protein
MWPNQLQRRLSLLLSCLLLGELQQSKQAQIYSFLGPRTLQSDEKQPYV